MTEALFPVDIFICQIDAAGESHLSVDHHNFSVVPVILAGGKSRHNGCKHMALDAVALQLLGIMVRQQGQTTHAVIEKTDFHALFHLCF